LYQRAVAGLWPGREPIRYRLPGSVQLPVSGARVLRGPSSLSAMKHLLILAAAAALAVSGAAGAAETPQRIMSLSLCTDQLLLQLVPKERITSVTYLSRSSEYAFLSKEANSVPINYGNAEEILSEHP